ncbi:hypothetical protein Bbelb_308100 [Branchiostoma belcheri]|nr:hypothetical protein Bbelb_308100 [Branchiostoma belcheri]
MTQRSTGGNTNQRARPCSVPLEDFPPSKVNRRRRRKWEYEPIRRSTFPGQCSQADGSTEPSERRVQTRSIAPLGTCAIYPFFAGHKFGVSSTGQRVKSRIKTICCIMPKKGFSRHFELARRRAILRCGCPPHFLVMCLKPAVAHNDCRAIVYRRQSKVGLCRYCGRVGPNHAQAQFWIVHAYPEPCLGQILARTVAGTGRVFHVTRHPRITMEQDEVMKLPEEPTWRNDVYLTDVRFGTGNSRLCQQTGQEIYACVYTDCLMDGTDDKQHTLLWEGVFKEMRGKVR